MHVWGYVAALKKNPDAEIVGVWDDNPERLAKFSEQAGVPQALGLDELCNQVDAVAIASENTKHAPLAQAAADQGKHILCEKPLVTNEEDAAIFEEIARKVKVMTAFPCRFAPSFQRLKERVQAGDIGKLKAVCATNRGSCPFDWFVQKELSGGGAMIDHTVHVADLLRALIGQEPVSVVAQTGSNIYGQVWEDTAMLTIEFPGGLFATLDSSWSRPKGYKTWGDVTMNVVGDKGVIDLDMFGQEIDVYKDSHKVRGYGSNLDQALLDAFVACVRDDTVPPVTARDGIQAARVAMAGYESARTSSRVALGS